MLFKKQHIQHPRIDRWGILGIFINNLWSRRLTVTTKEIVGSGKYTYEVDYHWAKLPEGWSMPAAAVFGDSQDLSLIHI